MVDLKDQLCYEVKKGDVESIRALLDQGVDVNSRNFCQETPLIVASCRGDAAIIAFLLDRNAHVESANDDGETPLIIASRLGYLKIVKLLVSKKASIHHIDHDGESSLFTAAIHGHLQVCKYLISIGARLDGTSDLGTLPYNYGCRASYPLSSDTWADHIASLYQALQDGPHPSQVQRRKEQL